MPMIFPCEIEVRHFWAPLLYDYFTQHKTISMNRRVNSISLGRDLLFKCMVAHLAEFSIIIAIVPNKPVFLSVSSTTLLPHLRDYRVRGSEQRVTAHTGFLV